MRTNQIGTKNHRNPKIINNKKLYKRVVGKRIRDLIREGPDERPENPARPRRRRPRPGQGNNQKRPSRQVNQNDFNTPLPLPSVVNSKGQATPPPAGGGTFTFPKFDEFKRRDYQTGFLPNTPDFDYDANQFESLKVDEENQLRAVRYAGSPTQNQFTKLTNPRPNQFQAPQQPSYRLGNSQASGKELNPFTKPFSGSTKTSYQQTDANRLNFSQSYLNRLNLSSPKYQVLVRQQESVQPNEIVFTKGQKSGVVGTSITIGSSGLTRSSSNKDPNTIYGKKIKAESRSDDGAIENVFPNYILNPRAASSVYFNRVSRTVPKEGTRVINNKPIRQWQWPDY